MRNALLSRCPFPPLASPTRPAPRRTGPGWRRLLAGGLLLTLSACGVTPARDPGPADSRVLMERLPTPAGATAGLPPPPPGTPTRQFSHERAALNEEVRVACLTQGASGEPEWLASLVTDLYLAGVAPDDATEVLTAGGCASLLAIVEEVVAQGGDEVVPSVLGRARRLGGQDLAAALVAAANLGLDRNLDTMGSGLPGNLSYAMAYYPSAGPVRQLGATLAINRLYETLAPGYAIYTFVLVGNAFAEEAVSEAPGATRHAELLRMIETYAGGASTAAASPPGAHVFLIPVHPELGAVPLSQQVAVDLSNAMRARLVLALRERGLSAVARRLQDGAGPFLMSGVEPALLPEQPKAPRLLVDLSRIGPEHMYSIVDAFDRTATGPAGQRAANLLALQQRLHGLAPHFAISDPTPEHWVLLLTQGPEPAAPGDRFRSLSPDPGPLLAGTLLDGSPTDLLGRSGQ